VNGQDTPSQQAAIKIFSQSDFQSLKQFQAEIASLGQLHHPNIAHLIDNAKTGNVFWFATTYVGEVSMGSIVSAGAVVPQKMLHTYATQLFAALAHAHRRQIVHGDVHPGNLVLTNDRSAIVLVDFGLSAIGGYRTQETLTHVEYRAPELLGDKPLVDTKNDVYSAAVTILTMARGHTPWKSSDFQALIQEIKLGAPSLVGLDESLAGFIAPLLSTNPAHRPSSENVFKLLQAGGFRSW
jgi:serine/threonine-protein kinase